MTKESIIEVCGVGKKYRIMHHRGGYIALRDVLTIILKSPLRFLKKKAKEIVGVDTKEDFWALRDVNFSVRRGEVIGIIGHNGAGKSTLLKILTGITPPTEGEVIMRGRVASLLEVGTGFHPELTGRENIFLNGAILGMTRKEIARKFNEIIEFAGIAKFLDTPVKYYSSGMYVRLAFSVAAHLEPDILLVDEVLAVGDAEFQKKCLGKMEEVTQKAGRTILFVSHNMGAIQNLCGKTILLEKGTVKMFGETSKVIDYYLGEGSPRATEVSYEAPNLPGDDVAVLHSARLIDERGEKLGFVTSNKKVGIEMIYEVKSSGHAPVPNVHLFTSKGETAFVSHAELTEHLGDVGRHRAVVWIHEDLLNDGTYIAGIALSTMVPLHIHFYDPQALTFDVMEDIESSRPNDFNQRVPGVVRPRLSWNLSMI